ncbi:MAG: elongation factor G [bacterium]
MAVLDIQKIRNIALVGHEGSGKTTLIEAFLFRAGLTSRMGSIREGNTVSDFDPDERDSGKSFMTSTLSFSHQGVHFNFLDVPGSPDCIGEALTALRAVECALICVDATSGVKVNTRRMWVEAQRIGLPCCFAITRLDAENTQFGKTLAEIQEHFGDRCIPVLWPDGSAGGFRKVAPVFPADGKIPEEVQPQREKLIEAVVEADDALMERYLEGEAIEEETLRETFRKALLERVLFPVLVVSSERQIGVDESLGFLASLTPSPDRFRRKALKGETEIPLDPANGFVGFVYRTVADEFVTRISTIRILSGRLASNSSFVNRRSGKTERLGPLLRVLGKEQKNLEDAGAGDIVAVAKIENMLAGDTLTDDKTDVRLPEIQFPTPMVSQAVKPKSRGDEQKIGTALKELAQDDRTFTVFADPQTGDLVVSGMSDLHLSLMLRRLKRRRKVEVETAPPKIPYKETITKSVQYVEYTHKKQTGGAGQYAKVYIDMEPNERGGGYEFQDKIFGGVIDQSLRPSVDKGIQAKMNEGVISGYPVVDVRVKLVDGKTHPVDSKDIAFQIAGREVFKKAFIQCDPVLLEPIVKVEIVVPKSNIGDVMGDLNSRRGRILTTSTEGPLSVVHALVPLAEVQSYQADLKSMTGGEGSYTVEFDHYDVVPAHIQKTIVAKYEAEQQQK